MKDYYEVVILTSYCDPNWGDDCSPQKPCNACLGISNVYRIPSHVLLENGEFIRELAPEQNVLHLQKQ